MEVWVNFAWIFEYSEDFLTKSLLLNNSDRKLNTKQNNNAQW